MNKKNNSNSVQLNLLENIKIKNTETKNRVDLELKPYIQPFEKILARAELSGLLDDVSFIEPFGHHASSKENISTHVPIEKLNRRLAYWQRVGCSTLKPTLQTLYETSKDPLTAQKIIQSSEIEDIEDLLPNRRVLRYGVHGIHEYRGKFFPQLVKALINFSEVSERAKILDPFCGSGTTICEAHALGMEALGIDLNPLSVLVSQVKTSLLSEDPEKLLSAKDYFATAFNNVLEAQPEKLWTNEDLKYLRKWFDEKALCELALIRKTIDLYPDQKLRSFFYVCLSNIIRTVSWQKVSDLRVRKEISEYQKGTAIKLFKEEVEKVSKKVASYLFISQHYQTSTNLLSFDVKEGNTVEICELLNSSYGQCDLLITSPPYATALPYIDTDRLSLIILGLLPRNKHRSHEFSMIGNREITKAQCNQLWKTYQSRRHELPDTVSSFIDNLAEYYHCENVGFRRRNLPSLLAKYFLDMTDAMSASRKMMRPESYAFFIVGNNSTYINDEKIEIPTNKFLWQIGNKVGWHQVDIVDMELLPSRDIFRYNRGSSEQILIFTSTPRRTSLYSGNNHYRYKRSTEEWNFSDEDTREHLHALHPYPARFIPQIPRKAIQEYSKPGDIVLDPFCGCGTTVLEGILLGRTSIGVDNNAVAKLISEAKVIHYSDNDINTLKSFSSEIDNKLPRKTSDLWKPSYKNLPFWFDETAISDLSKILYTINQLPSNSKTLALAVFSSIIVKASYQDSDTRYKKTEKKYLPGSAINWFKSKLTDTVLRLESIKDKQRASYELYLADSRKLSFLENETIDLIVTSPPYLNAYDYHKYHRQRLHWIKGEIELARDTEIGKHDKFTRKGATAEPYFEDMENCFKEWQRILKPEARAIILVGDSIVNGQPIKVADRFTEIMNFLGLILENHWIRQLPKNRKSFGKGSRINREHVLMYKKI